MIVGTHFGLFMPALRPDWKTLPNGEPELQVRSRRRIDLLNLKKFMEEHGLALGEPFAIKNTDYQWRAYCTRVAWGLTLSHIACDIDYTKFKDTPAKYHHDVKLTEAYGKIWTATLSAFPQGSVYTQPRHRTYETGQRFGKTQRQADETVVRRGSKDWVMAGSNPEQLAALMREIDNATADVVLPSEDELREVDAYERAHVSLEPLLTGPTELNGHLDHSTCAHNSTPSARRKCRKRFYGRF